MSPILRSVVPKLSTPKPLLQASAQALARPRALISSSRKLATMSGTKSSPPAKKMAHFPRMTTALPSEHGEFRTVMWTGESSQLVLMTIPVGGDIGEEVHHVDQHLVFTSGTAKAIIAGEEKEILAGDLVIVPQGTKHNFINTGPTPLILFTVYAPAEHDPKSVHKTKEEGDELEDAGKDEAPKWATGGNKE